MVLKELILNIFYFGRVCVVLKELILNSFYLRGCGGLERTDFTISTLGGCGGLERTDFKQFLF